MCHSYTLRNAMYYAALSAAELLSARGVLSRVLVFSESAVARGRTDLPSYGRAPAAASNDVARTKPSCQILSG
jgi:hypothetical protein